MNKDSIQLSTPNGDNQILLHSCCAPCSCAIIEALIYNNIIPTIYFYNPNIYPRDEYEKRKNENIRYVESLNLNFIDGDYNHREWLKSIAGLEKEPERGIRCQECFNIRLIHTAKKASEIGLRVFTTTLASSRWKRLDQINVSGKLAESFYKDTIYWQQNWRRGGLTERRSEIINNYSFYNQNYCGCEFSINSKSSCFKCKNIIENCDSKSLIGDKI